MESVEPAELAEWFRPERPGPLVFEQLLRTGRGRCLADRAAAPRAVLAELAANYALRGDPERLDLTEVRGFVDAPPEWLPALHATDPQTAVWDRLIAELPAGIDLLHAPATRPLTSADAPGLAHLAADLAWIHATWGGPDGMLADGGAHGVVVDGDVVSIAVPFWVGRRYEDIGVVTAAAHRGRGYSTACAAAVAADIRARGHVPTWTTSPDNTGSLAVAARLGFRQVRTDVLYAVRATIPRD